MNKNENSYSRNQCSLIIRVEGEEIEIPVNFGMTADEIKTLYPFILPLVNNKIKSPALEFAEQVKRGGYDGLSEEAYDELVTKMNLQSKFWFDKTEASLLDIAVRFAVDIKLKGIVELADIFDTPLPVESIKASPITDEEAEHIISSMQLETATDYEHDPGEEVDIPLGIAGSLNVNLYNSGETEEYLSQELDAMESKLDVKDKFSEILDNDLSDLDEDKYKSDYKAGKYEEHRVKDGLLDMYSSDNESKSVFDKMDEEDGLFAESDDSDDESYDDDESENYDTESADDDDLSSIYNDFMNEDNDISFEDDDGEEDYFEDTFEDFDEDGKDDE